MFTRLDTKENVVERLRSENKVVPFLFDPIFKSVLKDEKMKGVLSFLISEVTGLDKNYVMENIDFKDTELKRNRYLEKGKIADLIVYIENNIINIEANQVLNSGLIDKNNSYHYKIASEIIKNKLNPLVIQINIDRKNKFDKLVTEFRLRDETGKYVLDDKFINYHINIDNILKKEYNKDKLTRLEKILLLMITEDKNVLRQISKDDEEMNYMVDKLEEMALNDGIVGLYDKEKAMERVNAINKMEAINEGFAEGLEKGIEKGIKKGIEKGIEKGKKEGLNEAKKKMAKKMLDEGIDIELISKITELPKKEIEKLK